MRSKTGFLHSWFQSGRLRWWLNHPHIRKYIEKLHELYGWIQRYEIVRCQSLSYADTAWFLSFKLAELVWVCIHTSSTNILSIRALLTEIQGVVPCALLLQDHLEEMYSSRPFGEDATPLRQQLQGLCTLVVIWWSTLLVACSHAEKSLCIVSDTSSLAPSI